MKKLKSLFKFSLFVSFLGALFVAFYLEEWSLIGGQFEKACVEKGVRLPLEEPRLEVSVHNKTLSVFDGEVLIRRYDIGTGKGRAMGMLKKGSGSTPEGEYRIVRKAVRERIFSQGSRFMEIDYPNIDDIETAFERGVIDASQFQSAISARRNGDPMPDSLPIGDCLGIQGNHLLFMGANSTNGGVAMKNGDINDLYEYIPVGTPLVIHP
ncbi:MAG: L,D-transpeptidase [Planctomycetes bacterium]|nr:L,D-transpeptidase [Planctomycetota bacterium]